MTRRSLADKYPFRVVFIFAALCLVPYLLAAYSMQPPHLQDRVSGATVVIDDGEHHAHDGDAYVAHFESAAPLPTNIGEETAIGFNTPAAASGRVHMIIDVRADDESVWELREDPTVTLDTGQDLSAFNRFRDSANTSAMSTLDAAPTVGSLMSYVVAEAAAGDLSGGTILHSETIAIAGGAPFGGSSNNAVRGEREWILMAATEYIIIVTSSTANNTVHEITLSWYEHSPLAF